MNFWPTDPNFFGTLVEVFVRPNAYMCPNAFSLNSEQT